MLQLALRLGENPRQIVTTTPRPLPLLRQMLADPGSVISRMRTEDNAANLAASFIAEMRRRYDGTALGRQELDGEIITARASSIVSPISAILRSGPAPARSAVRTIWRIHSAPARVLPACSMSRASSTRRPGDRHQQTADQQTKQRSRG